ncbi:MAG: nucleotidyltransferase domain-containing protein [Elusimicrobia bacterium]|nr:nucleotidyltransferase domain-containing protein [Elusimicrobiota bacterium]
MQFKNYLDTIFSQPTKVRLLRFLFETRPEMTGRELARFSKISHMQVYRNLDDLNAHGIVIKKRVGGAYVFSLNEKNVLVKDVLHTLFQKEGKLLDDVLKAIFLEKTSNMLSVVVFGSSAKGEERPASDVDIFILTKNESESNLINDFLSDAELRFYEQTGNRLSPIVMTIAELKVKYKTNKTLFSRILSGKVVSGRSPEEFINGR